MSQFQRMIAIPQEEYLQLSTVQSVRQPLTEQLYNLERQYNQEERINDPYKRVILQSQTLEDMKQLKDQMRHSLTVSTPKPYRSRAQALLESVSSFVHFNERGEIYDKENNIIANTRLEDLIQHAVRDRRRNISPNGWKYFLTLLLENNIPKSILNRSTMEEMEEMTRSTNFKQDPPIVAIKRKRRKGKSPFRKRSKSGSPVRRSTRSRKQLQDPLASFKEY